MSINFSTVIFLLIGMLLGTIGYSILIFRKVDALMGVDLSDPEKDKYNLVVLCPLEDLRRKRYMIVEIKQSTHL